jgi:3-mercaptopropionate dioxygenase
MTRRSTAMPEDRAMATPNLERLRAFVMSFTELVAQAPRQSKLLAIGAGLLTDLIAHDDWLPDRFAQADAERYRQYLLHCDGQERFSVVSFVWGPGQETPIHNHTVWGLVGVLRGAELSQAFTPGDLGLVTLGEPERMEAGRIVSVSAAPGALHRVANALPDRASVSIHVYGGNIGRIQRTAWTAEGRARSFASGYSADVVPNLWSTTAETQP